MGTFGALYYGALFILLMRSWSENHCQTWVIAANLKRQMSFGTSLNMMQLIIGQNVARKRDQSAQSTLLGRVGSRLIFKTRFSAL